MTGTNLYASLQHTSAGCNRNVGNLCWGCNDLMAFGSHNAVVVYDPERMKVRATLLGHEEQVTCVDWLPIGKEEGHDGNNHERQWYLVSGGADGCVLLWSVHMDGDRLENYSWSLMERLEVHGAPVTSLTVEQDGTGNVMMVTTGGDGNATFWCLDIKESYYSWRLMETLRFGTKLPQSSAVGRLHGDLCTTVVALGFVDGSVRVYSRDDSLGEDYNDKNNNIFVLGCVLSGHQNWVRSLAFVAASRRLLLASASQDRHIRLWSIEPDEDAHGDDMTLSKLGITKYAPKPQMILAGNKYTAILESLLVGHEDWVMSVAWNVNKWRRQHAEEGQLRLLSSSMDRTMAVWSKDSGSGLWISSEVVGDAGVNHLGYYTCCWNTKAESIAAHGFTGAIHMWKKVEDTLEPKAAMGGHVAPIVDASWSKDGAFFLTVSTDQTARILSERVVGERKFWWELARPQIHGHDFSCVALFDKHSPNGSYKKYVYASGSEEKVIRIFESPNTFLDSLDAALGRQPVPRTPSDTNVLGATLPALGLSNKAIIEDEGVSEHETNSDGQQGYSDGADFAPSSVPSVVSWPPMEEHLSQNTLWPETHKLYGHGNDLFCIAASPCGRFLASSSRAQTQSTAKILIWDTTQWQQLCEVDGGHSLTVTQLAFSPDGNYLASVGRDRKLGIHKKVRKDDGIEFQTCTSIKAHSRIIWGASWSSDSTLLATASRDSSVKIWRVQEGSVGPDPVALISCESSVQTVAFADLHGPQLGMTALAAGMESGDIKIYEVQYSVDKLIVSERVSVNQTYKHSGSVRRVCWRPSMQKSENAILASVGDDHCVKIWEIKYS